MQNDCAICLHPTNRHTRRFLCGLAFHVRCVIFPFPHSDRIPALQTPCMSCCVNKQGENRVRRCSCHGLKKCSTCPRWRRNMAFCQDCNFFQCVRCQLDPKRGCRVDETTGFVKASCLERYLFKELSALVLQYDPSRRSCNVIEHDKFWNCSTCNNYRRSGNLQCSKCKPANNVTLKYNWGLGI
jgi:hypothetical protein